MNECDLHLNCPCYEVKDQVFTMIRRIPSEIMDEIVCYFAQDLRYEAILQVYYDEKMPGSGFFIVEPIKADTSREHVSYTFPYVGHGVLVLTIHSHNQMDAFFSAVDDRDELYMPGLYGVVGRIRDIGDSYEYETAFRIVYDIKKEIRLGRDEIFEFEYDG